ncbi:hypothetical protein DPMN_078740 [Dreissena polymorpha]|uniref:Uncharacterized protein n=1 Tax=Dreissena polymorpha TaxID=45954 RepID=A0A9D4BQJ0_DREPO|nr:hypothetical protein DPMN_078740 [Dreissena polymorpha]
MVAVWSLRSRRTVGAGTPWSQYDRSENAKDAAQTQYGRLWSPLRRSTNAVISRGTYKGRREDAQDAINQDAGVTGRQKTAFLPKKSLASLLRQSEISRNTVLGRRKDATPV